MTRAITTAELAKLRATGQSSRLALAIHQPTVVYTCHSSIMSSNDQVTALGYNTGVGTLADVLAGMTCYIGATDGGHELGIVRIRKAPDASYIYINETSDIDWSASHYLTVVDEFLIWPKHWRLTDPQDANSVQMDWEIAYTDQNEVLDPIVNLGPDQVLWNEYAATFAFSTSCFNPAQVVASPVPTWAGTGSPVITYPEAPPFAARTATFTWAAAGTYRISCSYTLAGKTFTAHRYVFIYDDANPPVTEFEVTQSPQGNYDAGGWSFGITLYDNASQALVRDRARCILFATSEHYGDTAGSLGPVAGCEEILCNGWIAGESISPDPGRGGSVRFQVQGPQYWLSRIYEFPVGVKYAASPASWLYVVDLTANLAIWHLLHWRTTASAIMDIIFPLETLALLPASDTPNGSAWAQIEVTASAIGAHAACNRYGQFHLYRDANLYAVSSRGAIPVVMTLTDEDFTPPVVIERHPVSEVANLDSSGVMFDGATSTPLLARAPGHAPKAHGESAQEDNLLVFSQEDLNNRTGLLLGKRNNEFPAVQIDLAANNRFVDIAPPQYVKLSITAEDGIDRITWTNKRLVPRIVELRVDGRGGSVLTSMSCEAETLPENAVMIPVIPPTVYNWPDLPEIGGFSFLPDDLSFPPIVVPTETGYEEPSEEGYTCLAMTDPNYASGVENWTPGLVTVQDKSEFPEEAIWRYYGPWPLDYSPIAWYLYPGDSTPPMGIAYQGTNEWLYMDVADIPAEASTLTAGFGVRPPAWTNPTSLSFVCDFYNWATLVPTDGIPRSGWYQLSPYNTQDMDALYEFSVTFTGGSLLSPLTLPCVNVLDGVDFSDTFGVDFSSITEPFWFEHFRINYSQGPDTGKAYNDESGAYFVAFWSLLAYNVVDIYQGVCV